MPDAQGQVTVSAAAGAFPPGANVLVVNATNGMVASSTAGNDGSITDTSNLMDLAVFDGVVDGLGRPIEALRALGQARPEVLSLEP